MKYLKIELIAETHYMIDEEEMKDYCSGLSVMFSNLREGECDIRNNVSIDKPACRPRISEISYKEFIEKFNKACSFLQIQIKNIKTAHPDKS